MKDFLKQNWLFVFLLLGMICNCICQCSMFGGSFFSLWDESYCLLKCRDAYDHIVTGKTQWDLIAVHWFPYLDLTSKISSSWASFILILATLLNTTIAMCLITRKKDFVKYAAIFLLLLLPVISGGYAAEVQNRIGWTTCISYLVLQVFLLGSSFPIFLLYYYRQENSIKYTSLVITGILVGLSVFVILPSGVLMILLYMAHILLFNYKNREIWKYLGLYLSGILCSLIYVHVCIADLTVIFQEMQFTASYVKESGVGYTPLDFAKSIIQRFVELALLAPLGIGIYALAYEIEKNTNKYLELFIILIYILVYSILMWKEMAYLPTTPMFLIFLLLFVFVCRSEQTKTSTHQILQILFLLVTPIVCSIGTNTHMWGRIGCFMIPWGVLWLMAEHKSTGIKSKLELQIAMILILFIPISFNSARMVYHNKKYATERFKEGSRGIAELDLTKAQANYFRNVNEIFKQYNYTPNKSIVFATAWDYCTVYAFDAKLSSNFHLPQNFQFFTDKMLCPDFIFISARDKYTESLKDMPWGWPEEFDVYHLESPETTCLKLISDTTDIRTLYCRKSLKKAE